MKKLLFLIALPMAFMITSCKKQPAACFSSDKTSVEIGETVSFESCATDAETIEWDFGDGTTAEGESAAHSWDAPGTYLVQMKVLSKKDKKIDRFSATITVKGYTRYLTKAVLKDYAETKPDGSLWDQGGFIPTGPEPDVYLRFRLAGSTSWEFTTSVKSNITPADLPFTWNLTQQNIYLSNQSVEIEVRDDNSFGSTFASELMKAWTINPATAGENEVIKLTDITLGYELELHFENRQ